MKIIDFEKKGNIVRFYLGEDNLEKWWGDDWNDTPYEHNAGTVYDKFISAYIDIAFPFDWEIYEPGDDWNYRGNSPYCKEDFIKRQAPCIVAIPEDIGESMWNVQYSTHMAHPNCIKFYYGDKINVPEYNKLYVYMKGEFIEEVQTFGLI